MTTLDIQISAYEEMHDSDLDDGPSLNEVSENDSGHIRRSDLFQGTHDHQTLHG